MVVKEISMTFFTREGEVIKYRYVRNFQKNFHNLIRFVHKNHGEIDHINVYYNRKQGGKFITQIKNSSELPYKF